MLTFPPTLAGLQSQSLRMSEIHNVLFDLDGTLVDSSGAIRASLVHALERLGTEWPDGIAVESVIGMPLLDILGERLGITGDRAELGIRYYREHYDAHAREQSRVYDHVEELLERLPEDVELVVLSPGAEEDHMVGAMRWLEAHEAGRAPPVFLQSTHERVLEIVQLDDLLPYALDLPRHS